MRFSWTTLNYDINFTQNYNEITNQLANRIIVNFNVKEIIYLLILISRNSSESHLFDLNVLFTSDGY